MTAALRIEVENRVMVATLDRPAKRNALTRASIEALRLAAARLAAEDVGAFILTGGDTCFSAGADIKELEGSAADIDFDEALGVLVAAVRAAPCITIAAVDGPCVGAGFDLAMAFDVRIASPQAFFQLPAIRLGLLYNPAAVLRLARLLPETTLKRLLLLGERIDGCEAVTAGIASHAADNRQTLDVAKRIASAACPLPARAFSATKRLLLAAEDGVRDPKHWQDLRIELLASPERRQALNAVRARS